MSADPQLAAGDAEPQAVATASPQPISPAVAPSSAGEPYLIVAVKEAVRQGNLEMLRSLLEMQHQEEDRQAKKDFEAALARAQGNIDPIKKSKLVDFKTDKGQVRYKHETLADVIAAVDKPLSDEGLTKRWRLQQPEGRVRVTCIISHAGGHFEENSLEAGADTSGSKNAIQAIKSTVTYLERTTLLAALGIAAEDEDDDGRASGSPLIDEEQAAHVRKQLKDLNVTEATLLRAVGAREIVLMTVDQYKDALSRFANKRKEREEKAKDGTAQP